MARMLGRLGWHGQCSCCCGPCWEKAKEKRQWPKDQAEFDATCPCHAVDYAGEEPFCIGCDSDYADLCTECRAANEIEGQLPH